MCPCYVQRVEHAYVRRKSSKQRQSEDFLVCDDAQASWSHVKTDQWYYVEISWSSDSGVEIYVDLKKVANSHATTRQSGDQISSTESRLCVGCLNAPKNATDGLRRVAANTIIDELQICYGSCAKLTEFQFLQRGTPDVEIPHSFYSLVGQCIYQSMLLLSRNKKLLHSFSQIVPLY